MKPLYEITNDYQKLVDLIENSDEITAEHLKMLGDIEGDAKQKCVNVASYIKNLQELDHGIDKAICEMAERQKKIGNKIESLKEYLKYNMESLNIKEVKSPHFDIKIRENNYALDIVDEFFIPKDYYREKLTVTLNREKIIKDMKNDIVIGGVQFKKTKTVSIK